MPVANLLNGGGFKCSFSRILNVERLHGCFVHIHRAEEKGVCVVWDDVNIRLNCRYPQQV